MQKLWPLINARFCESSLLTTTITELLRSQLYTQTNEFLDCCSTFTEKRNLAGVNRAPARQKYVMNKISTVIQMRCSFSVLQKSTCLRWNGQRHKAVIILTVEMILNDYHLNIIKVVAQYFIKHFTFCDIFSFVN